MSLQLSQGVVQGLVFPLFTLQLEVHVFYLRVVALKLAENHLFILAVRELSLDMLEVVDDFRQFVRVGLLIPGLFE